MKQLLNEKLSNDLDYLVIELEGNIGTSPHSRESIKETLVKAIEAYKKDKESDLNDPIIDKIRTEEFVESIRNYKEQ